MAATTEQINGFKDFEKNLEKLGIQQGISMEEARPIYNRSKRVE
jgi:hypothetical protein